MYRVSSLGRPLDPRYRSNLNVILASAVAGLSVAIYNGVARVPLDASPIVAAVTVFLAWAIGRELDPDRSTVASLAMAFAFVALLVGPAELMLGAGALAASRIISGTVGGSLRGIDLLALVGLAALLGAGGITAAAIPGLLLAATIGTTRRGHGLFLAGGLLVAGAAGALLARPAVVWDAGPAAGVIMLAVVLASIVIRMPIGSIAAQADLGGALSPRRIALSRLVAAGTVGVAFLLGGGAGVVAAFPTAGAAVAAAGVVGLTNRRVAVSRADIEEASSHG